MVGVDVVLGFLLLPEGFESSWVLGESVVGAGEGGPFREAFLGVVATSFQDFSG